MTSFERCEREPLRADDQLVSDSHVADDGLQIRNFAIPPLDVGQGFDFSYPAAHLSPCSEAFEEAGQEFRQHPNHDQLAELVAGATVAGLHTRLSVGGSKSDLGALAKTFVAALKTAGIRDATKKALQALVSELPKLRGAAYAKRVDTIHGVASTELKASEPELFRAYSRLRAEALKHK